MFESIEVIPGVVVGVVRKSSFEVGTDEDAGDALAIHLEVAAIQSTIPQIVALRSQLGLTSEDCVYRNVSDAALLALVEGCEVEDWRLILDGVVPQNATDIDRAYASVKTEWLERKGISKDRPAVAQQHWDAARDARGRASRKVRQAARRG